MIRCPVPHGHSKTAHFSDPLLPTITKVRRWMVFGTHDCDSTYTTLRILALVNRVLRYQSMTCPVRSTTGQGRGRCHLHPKFHSRRCKSAWDAAGRRFPVSNVRRFAQAAPKVLFPPHQASALG
jgi:hypothetical protein